jgi:hypothetical protein
MFPAIVIVLIGVVVQLSGVTMQLSLGSIPVWVIFANFFFMFS